MQQSSFPTTEYILSLDIPVLDSHLQSFPYDYKQYNFIVLGMAREYRVIKIKLDQAEKQNIDLQNAKKLMEKSLLQKLKEAEKQIELLNTKLSTESTLHQKLEKAIKHQNQYIVELPDCKLELNQMHNNQNELVNPRFHTEQVPLQKLDEALTQNKQLLIDLSISKQMLNLMQNNMRDQDKIHQQTIQSIMDKYKQILNNQNELLEAQKNSNNELTLKNVDLPLSEKILPDGIAQDEFLKNLEKLWSDVSSSSKEVQKKLSNFMELSRTRNNTDFLVCQNTQRYQRMDNLEKLKFDFLDIKRQAEIFRQYVEREKSNKDQNTQNILSQVLMLVTYNEKMIQRSLDLIYELGNEQEKQNKQTEILLEQNQILSQNVQQITQDHINKIAALNIKFTQEKEKLIQSQAHKTIQNQYNKNQIQELSELSLKIHKKFYEKIQNDLSKLSISFVNIAIRNILGSYLSSKESNDSILQNKQLAIQETERFRRSTQNGENNEISKFIDNSKRLLNVFENFFSQSRKDSKSKCFTISFINSQKAINQLQIYLESIQQGVQEFIKEHQKLKNLESQLQQ